MTPNESRAIIAELQTLRHAMRDPDDRQVLDARIAELIAFNAEEAAKQEDFERRMRDVLGLPSTARTLR